MSNYLTIAEAVDLSGISKEEFNSKYIDGGIISVRVENGEKSIELSEFLRVFPSVRVAKTSTHPDPMVELQLKQLKIENLEYQIASLQRQLERQNDEYEWLRGKFDNTTLLLEQKLDTSELDQYKQEIRQLSQQAMQWEKKYNTLLAANELKTLVKENRELKEQLAAKDSKQHIDPANNVKTRTNSLLEGQPKSQREEPIKSVEPIEPEPLGDVKAKRRKIFGIF